MALALCKAGSAPCMLAFAERGWARHWMRDGLTAASAAALLAGGGPDCRALAMSWPERGWPLMADPEFPLRGMPEQAALGSDPEFAAFILDRIPVEAPERADGLRLTFMAMATRPAADPAMSGFAFDLIQADPGAWAALRQEGSSFSPMMQCFKNGRLDLAEAMLRADPEGALASCSPEQEPAMAFPLLRSSDPAAAAALLLRFGADPLATDPRAGAGPLHWAAAISPGRGRAVAKSLTQAGADPRAPDFLGRTPIAKALLSWPWPAIQEAFGAEPADLLGDPARPQDDPLRAALASARVCFEEGATHEEVDARLALACQARLANSADPPEALAKAWLGECVEQGLPSCFSLLLPKAAGWGAPLREDDFTPALKGPCRYPRFEAASLECLARWSAHRIDPATWGRLADMAGEARLGRPGDDPPTLAALALRHEAALILRDGAAPRPPEPLLAILPSSSRDALARWASMAERAALDGAADPIHPPHPLGRPTL